MSVLGPDHDPSNFEGFTQFHLEIYDRFASTAVEWHLDDNLSMVNAHELGIVDIDQLVSQYNLPVVFTIPTGTDNQSRTTHADTEILTYSVSAWVADWNQPYALIDAQVIIGNIINNVENNRTLTNQNGEDPLAEDAGKVESSFDFQLNPRQERGHLKYGTAKFEVKTKRKIPVPPTSNTIK